MNRALKYLVGTMAMLPSLLVAEAEEQHYILTGDGLQKADSSYEDVRFLTEEEVLGWCAQEPDSLKDEAYTKYGFTWHSIYESMKRDSFAYVPFTVEKYEFEYHRDRPHLKEFMTWHRDVCDCPFEDLIIIHYRSPQWTWNALAGREGLLPICRKHKKQFTIMLWSMN